MDQKESHIRLPSHVSVRKRPTSTARNAADKSVDTRPSRGTAVADLHTAKSSADAKKHAPLPHQQPHRPLSRPSATSSSFRSKTKLSFATNARKTSSSSNEPSFTAAANEIADSGLPKKKKRLDKLIEWKMSKQNNRSSAVAPLHAHSPVPVSPAQLKRREPQHQIVLEQRQMFMQSPTYRELLPKYEAVRAKSADKNNNADESTTDNNNNNEEVNSGKHHTEKISLVTRMRDNQDEEDELDLEAEFFPHVPPIEIPTESASSTASSSHRESPVPPQRVSTPVFEKEMRHKSTVRSLSRALEKVSLEDNREQQPNCVAADTEEQGAQCAAADNGIRETFVDRLFREEDEMRERHRKNVIRAREEYEKVKRVYQNENRRRKKLQRGYRGCGLCSLLLALFRLLLLGSLLAPFALSGVYLVAPETLPTNVLRSLDQFVDTRSVNSAEAALVSIWTEVEQASKTLQERYGIHLQAETEPRSSFTYMVVENASDGGVKVGKGLKWLIERSRNIRHVAAELMLMENIEIMDLQHLVEKEEKYKSLLVDMQSENSKLHEMMGSLKREAQGKDLEWGAMVSELKHEKAHLLEQMEGLAMHLKTAEEARMKDAERFTAILAMKDKELDHIRGLAAPDAVEGVSKGTTMEDSFKPQVGEPEIVEQEVVEPEIIEPEVSESEVTKPEDVDPNIDDRSVEEVIQGEKTWRAFLLEFMLYVAGIAAVRFTCSIAHSYFFGPEEDVEMAQPIDSTSDGSPPSEERKQTFRKCKSRNISDNLMSPALGSSVFIGWISPPKFSPKQTKVETPKSPADDYGCFDTFENLPHGVTPVRRSRRLNTPTRMDTPFPYDRNEQ